MRSRLAVLALSCLLTSSLVAEDAMANSSTSSTVPVVTGLTGRNRKGSGPADRRPVAQGADGAD